MATTPPVKINSKRLTSVRKRLGMSEEAAAKKIGIDAEELRSWEAGEAYPSFGKLRKMASVFKRPTSFFLENLDFEEIQIPSADFRVMDGEKVESLSPAIIEAFRVALNKRRLLIDASDYIEVPSVELPFRLSIDKSPANAGAALAAKYGIIEKLKKSQSPSGLNLKLWRKQIESCGVLVFQMKLGEPKEIRGASLFFKQLPIIILNQKDEVAARVFTLLHEFCHILLNTGGICNVSSYDYNSKSIDPIEVFCNRFAASALVPKSMLQLETGMDLKRFISRAAKQFGVSQFVIVRRLHSLEIIDQQTYRAQTKRLDEDYLNYLDKKSKQNLSDYRRNIVRESITENGQLYLSMMFKGYRRDVFGMSELSEGIGAKSKHFEKIRKQMHEDKE